MKNQPKLIAAATLALIYISGAAQAGTITFDSRTWNTLDSTGNESSGINLNNAYSTPDANTGVIGGRYGADSAIETALTLGVGYTVSYDLYLSNNDPGYSPGANGGTYYGDWTSEFMTGTAFGSGWSTARTFSASNSGDNHTWLSLYNGNGGSYFNVTSGLNTGVHLQYTFGLNTYNITATSIANPSDTETINNISYWNGGTVADIQAFRAGLYDSEQISTVQNFTVMPPAPAPEPGTISLLALGSLGVIWARRRRN